MPPRGFTWEKVKASYGGLVPDLHKGGKETKMLLSNRDKPVLYKFEGKIEYRNQL